MALVMIKFLSFKGGLVFDNKRPYLFHCFGSKRKGVKIISTLYKSNLHKV